MRSRLSPPRFGRHRQRDFDLDTPFPITDSQIQEFSLKGHTCLRGLMSRREVAYFHQAIAAAVARLNQETRPLEDRDTYGRAFLQTGDLYKVDERVARFVLSKRFARAAAELVGAQGLRLHHDQALFKEPSGGFTPWHQDQIYWPLDTNQCISMWMPLVDISADIGSLIFASGSNRMGPLVSNISDDSQAEATSAIEQLGLALHSYGPLRAGDATFHGGWTLHHAAVNPTSQMRPVMTVGYFPEGTRLLEPENNLQLEDLRSRWPGLAPGDLAASEAHPLIWSNDS